MLLTETFEILHAHLCHVTCNIKSQAMNDNKTLVFYLLFHFNNFSLYMISKQDLTTKT